MLKDHSQLQLSLSPYQGLYDAIIPEDHLLRRIKENIDIFDFELNEEEMKQISSLDMGQTGSRAKHFDTEFVEMCLAKKIHD